MTGSPRICSGLAKVSVNARRSVTVAFVAGATESRFTDTRHHVLLIGTGADIHNRPFCVVYDPDVTATQKSQQAWAACRGPKVDVNARASDTVVNQMVLGAGTELGGLVRYFYPDCAG